MSTQPPSGRVVEALQKEYVLSTKDLGQIIRQQFWIIALVTTVVVGAVVSFSLMQTPMYEASIKVLVGQEQRSSTPGSLGSDVQGLQQLTQTMAEGVDSRPIAEAVIQRQGLQMTSRDFLDNMSVQQTGTTQFIQIDYRDPSPERAQRIVNAIGEVFSEQVSDISPSANAVTATVWERAEVPEGPTSPNMVLNTVLALIIGLMFGGGLAFLLEYLDNSWRTPEELEEVSGVPTFGVIPELESPKNKNGKG